MSGGVILGVDLGTTSTKVVAFDDAGREVARASHGYALDTPEPGAAEQDADLVLDAALRGLRDVTAQVGAAAVGGIGLSGAMHSVLPVGPDDRPLGRAMTWADGRPERWARHLREHEDALGVSERTGTPPYAMSPVAKLRWLHEERASVARAAARFVSIKEYVLHGLCGAWAVDHSVASATGLLDGRRLGWDDAALTMARVTPERLSPPVPTTTRLPSLRPEAARFTGLPLHVPLVIGGNDGALATLGSAVGSGEAAVSLGTSGAVRVLVDAFTPDPEGRTFCYSVTPDRWVVGGATNAGAVVLRWLRETVLPDLATEADLLKLAGTAPDGAGGLLFLPYLLGERAPLWSADVRGAFVGLDVRHERRHLARAALEGVALNLAVILDLVEARAGAVTTLRLSGGLARSEVWRQLLADVTGRAVEVGGTVETSAFGAALLTRRALGLPPVPPPPVLHAHEPDMNAHDGHREARALFTRLGAVLLDERAALTARRQR